MSVDNAKLPGRVLSALVLGLLAAWLWPAIAAHADDPLPRARVVTVTADTGPSPLTGTPVTLTAEASGGTGTYEYEFWLYGATTSYAWAPVRTYTTNPTYSLNGLGLVGVYYIQVRARNVGSSAQYEAVRNYRLVFRQLPLELTATHVGAQETGVQVQYTASVPGGTGNYEFRFMLYDRVTVRGWAEARPFSTSNTWTFDTRGLIGAQYVMVYVRNAGSTADNEGWARQSVVLRRHPLTLTSDQAASIGTGTPVTYTASVPNGTGSYEYRFMLYGPKTGYQWAEARGWSSVPSWQFDTRGALGAYTVMAYVRTAGSTADDEGHAVGRLALVPHRLVLTSDQPASVGTGTSVTYTASVVNGAASYEYRFMVYGPKTGYQWAEGRGWSANPQWQFDTIGALGAHTVMAYVRTAGSTADDEGHAVARLALVPHRLTVTSDQPASVETGTPVTYTASVVNGAASYEYRFMVYGPKTGYQWAEGRGWSANPQWQFDTIGALGAHSVMAYVRTAGSTADDEGHAVARVSVIPPRATLTADLPSPQATGSRITLTAGVTNPSLPYEYQFWLYGPGTDYQWQVVRDYAPSASWVFDTIGHTGRYYGRVYVRLQGSQNDYDALATLPVTLGPLRPVVTVDKTSPQIIGEQVTFTAAVPNGNGSYEYEFRMYGMATNYQWQVVRAYSANPNWTWDTTDILGVHTVQAYARNVGSALEQEGIGTARFQVIPEPPVRLVTVTSDVPSPQEPAAVVTFTAEASGGSGDYEYQWQILGPSTGNVWVEVQPYSPNNTWTWDSGGALGSHTILVRARNKSSIAAWEAQRSMVMRIQHPAVVVFASNFEWLYSSQRDAQVHGWSYEQVKNKGRRVGGAQIGTTALVARTGARALQCQVPTLDPATIASEGATQKSMLGYTGRLWTRQDILTFTADFYIPSSSRGRFTFFDLEDNRNHNAGIRFQLEDGNIIYNADKLNLRVISRPATVPKNRWFQVKVEVKIGESGRVQVWVDGRLVMREYTSTITGAISSYTSVQAGMTARLNDPYLLYVDNVELTRAPLDSEPNPSGNYSPYGYDSQTTLVTAQDTTTQTTTTESTTLTTTSTDTGTTNAGGTGDGTSVGGVGGGTQLSALADLTPAPNRTLGLSFPGTDPAAFDAIAGAGLGLVRLPVEWSAVEPAAGQYDWAALDARVHALQQRGLTPVLELYSDAAWATLAETAGVKNRTPVSADLWRGFVTAVVERYDADGSADAPGLLARIDHMQVANEWMSATNTQGGWASSTDDLIAYVTTAYDAAKAASPDCVVLLGGIASINLDVMVLHEGLATYTIHQTLADGAELTITPADAAGAGYAAKIQEAYRVLENARYDLADLHLYGPVVRDPYRVHVVAQHTNGRPLAATEAGGPSLDYETYTPRAHFLAVLDRNLTALAEGLRFVQWAGLTEDGTATWAHQRVALRDADGQPKPGYRAYQLLASLLAGVERVEQLDDGVFVLYRANGSPLVVAWNTGGNDTLDLPASFVGTQVLRVADDATAAQYTLTEYSGGAVDLSAMPVVAGDLPATF